MEHGGDLLTYKNCFDGRLVDFSSNINPLGFPEGLEERLKNSFDTLTSYPDIQYRALRKSVSNYLNCDYNNVLVGNGAVEIINDFIMLADRVMVMVPGFSEYENRALIHGKKVVRIPYKKDFTVDIDILRDLVKKDDLLILGNPNNPTGLRIKEDTLSDIYLLMESGGGYLLLDEAFFEFCPKDYNSIELFKKYNYRNVGIIRAATKFFALPGIRLGYGCASDKKVEEIRKIRLPWSINSLADISGQYICNNKKHIKDYIEKSRDYIERERDYLQGELSKISGIVPVPSHSNYILIKLIDWDGEYIFNFFLEKGILIRKFGSFVGLPKNYIRIAVKDSENNRRLIQIFKELNRLSEHKGV